VLIHGIDDCWARLTDDFILEHAVRAACAECLGGTARTPLTAQCACLLRSDTQLRDVRVPCPAVARPQDTRHHPHHHHPRSHTRCLRERRPTTSSWSSSAAAPATALGRAARCRCACATSCSACRPQTPACTCPRRRWAWASTATRCCTAHPWWRLRARSRSRSACCHTSCRRASTCGPAARRTVRRRGRPA
jgi:hypothetical protein